MLLDFFYVENEIYLNSQLFRLIIRSELREHRPADGLRNFGIWMNEKKDKKQQQQRTKQKAAQAGGMAEQWFCVKRGEKAKKIWINKKCEADKVNLT